MNTQQDRQQQQIVKQQHIYDQVRQQYMAAVQNRQEFPKWKYHEGQKPYLVNNSAEEEALGPEWQDDRILEKDSSGQAVEENAFRQEIETLKKKVAALEKP